MPKVKVKIDKRELLSEMARGKNKRIMNNTIAEVVRQEAQDARNRMLKDFDEHPVTQEIEGQGRVDNISNTIESRGDANLFNFIGFPLGSNPLAFTRKLLSKKTQAKVKKSIFRRGLFTVSVNIPDKEFLETKARMPWADGLSWMKGIEEGIPNIVNFLNKPHKNSRSGRGIQVDKKFQKRFRKRDYMTEIYDKFFRRIGK